MLKVFQFGDVVEKYIDNRGKTPPLSDEGIPLLEVKHLPKNARYPILKTSKHVSQEVYDTQFRSHLQTGDILFSTVGTTARVSITPDHPKIVIAQNVLGLRFKLSVLDPLFAFYYLRAKPFQNEVEARLITTVQASIKRSDMVGIPMHLPELSEQKAIASILGALDDKIENNRRMNETLEEMVRTIFKSWFVDFDPVRAKATGKAPAHMDADTSALFPNSFGDDGLPMGWRLRKLGNCVSLTKGRSYKSAELQDSDTALVSLKSFQRGGGYRSDGLKAYTGTYKDEQILVSGDLIVALTDVTQVADVIGKPAIVRSNNEFKILVASLDVGVIRPIVPSVSIPFLYCMMMMHDFQSHIYGHTSGTTVLHLGKEGVPKYEFGMPSCEVLDRFTDLAQSIFSKIEMNENNSKTLAELRDTLLLKLISGEIRVADAEREVEAL